METIVRKFTHLTWLFYFSVFGGSTVSALFKTAHDCNALKKPQAKWMQMEMTQFLSISAADRNGFELYFEVSFSFVPLFITKNPQNLISILRTQEINMNIQQ